MKSAIRTIACALLLCVFVASAQTVTVDFPQYSNTQSVCSQVQSCAGPAGMNYSAPGSSSVTLAQIPAGTTATDATNVAIGLIVVAVVIIIFRAL